MQQQLPRKGCFFFVNGGVNEERMQQGYSIDLKTLVRDHQVYRSANGTYQKDMLKDFLISWDKELEGSRRNILLILDNSATQVKLDIKLRRINILYLPKCTTSLIQPMDRGPIDKFKSLYEDHVYQLEFQRVYRAKYEEIAEESYVTVVEKGAEVAKNDYYLANEIAEMDWIAHCWSEVSSDLIKEAFRFVTDPRILVELVRTRYGVDKLKKRSEPGEPQTVDSISKLIEYFGGWGRGSRSLNLEAHMRFIDKNFVDVDWREKRGRILPEVNLFYFYNSFPFLWPTHPILIL